MNVNQQGKLHNLEQGNHVDKKQEDSSQMIHGRSGYQRRNHLVQEHADEKDLQREIEDLKNNNNNCRVTNRSPNPDRIGYGPNKPSTINL